MERGERITNKTRAAIKQALLELIHEKNYPEITVNQITQTGNVCRSMFYKHCQSKADVLVDIHKDMFNDLFTARFPTSKRLGDPPPGWVNFLKQNRRLGKNPFSLSYKLGNDLDYLPHICIGL